MPVYEENSIKITIAVTDTLFKPNQVPKTDEKLPDFGKADTRVPNQITEAQLKTLRSLLLIPDYVYIKGQGSTIEQIKEADSVIVIADIPGYNDNMSSTSFAINLNKNVNIILPDGSITKSEYEIHKMKSNHNGK